MKAYLFPGQGAQYPGMGKELYRSSQLARALFKRADALLGFEITKIMFTAGAEALRETRVTQPAVFLDSAIRALTLSDFRPEGVAGHSLGEFSALVANQTLDFEGALSLVSKRAKAMQRATEIKPSTMAAILGMRDKEVEKICADTPGTVVAANYNCPGQVVISGEMPAVQAACDRAKALGARLALQLAVGGAFHSPLMEPAREELAKAIGETNFKKPICPIYQNVCATAVSDPDAIRENLIAQLTEPVRWTQSIQRMIRDGATEFIEVGPGKVLQGLVKKIDRNATAYSA